MTIKDMATNVEIALDVVNAFGCFNAKVTKPVHIGKGYILTFKYTRHYLYYDIVNNGICKEFNIIDTNNIPCTLHGEIATIIYDTYIKYVEAVEV